MEKKHYPNALLFFKQHILIFEIILAQLSDYYKHLRKRKPY